MGKRTRKDLALVGERCRLQLLEHQLFARELRPVNHALREVPAQLEARLRQLG